MYPTNSSCWKIDQSRRYCPAPTDTNTRQYCLGKENTVSNGDLGTECTLATVGFRLRHALLVSNVFPFAKHHLPRGLRVSIGPCCRPSRRSVELINREPWCPPASLPPCPRARLAICHRSYGGCSVCTLPHLWGKWVTKRDDTWNPLIRPTGADSVKERSGVVRLIKRRVFSHKRCV